MPLVIDEQAVTTEAANVGEAIAWASEHLRPQGRIVVEVNLDGRALSEPDLQNASEVGLAGHELALTSAEPVSLTVSVLLQVKAKLEELGALQGEAAELLQKDQNTEAFQRVGEAVEVWQQTQQAVLHSAALVGLDLDAVRVHGQPLTHYTDQLLAMLQELKSMLESGDTLALADAMAYEWPEVTDQWAELIDELVTQIQAAADQA